MTATTYYQDKKRVVLGSLKVLGVRERQRKRAQPWGHFFPKSLHSTTFAPRTTELPDGLAPLQKGPYQRTEDSMSQGASKRCVTTHPRYVPREERLEQKQSTSMCVHTFIKETQPQAPQSSDTPRHVQVRDKQNQLPKTHIQGIS